MREAADSLWFDRIMRIACLNIHAGRCGTGANRNALPEIAEQFRVLTPDLCLLQEVDRRMPRSGFVDQASQLARAMRSAGESEWYFAFYGRLDWGPLGQYGNAILSRHPISEIKRLPLPADGGEARGAIRVVIPGDRPLAIWSVHLGLRDSWRLTQLAALADAVNDDQTAGYAVVVGGDFNASVNAPEVVHFVAESGMITATPDLPTFPAIAPTHRIDFLFTSPPLSVFDAGVVPHAPASDHCLIWADITP